MAKFYHGRKAIDTDGDVEDNLSSAGNDSEIDGHPQSASESGSEFDHVNAILEQRKSRRPKNKLKHKQRFRSAKTPTLDVNGGSSKTNSCTTPDPNSSLQVNKHHEGSNPTLQRTPVSSGGKTQISSPNARNSTLSTHQHKQALVQQYSVSGDRNQNLHGLETPTTTGESAQVGANLWEI